MTLRSRPFRVPGRCVTRHGKNPQTIAARNTKDKKAAAFMAHSFKAVPSI